MTGSPSRYRWTVVVWLLFLISMVNFGDRAALGAVVPLLVKAYHFTPKELGWILSAFGFGYCAMQLLGSGAMVRWLQPRALIGTMSVLWSIFVGLLVFAGSVNGFFILRLLFGAAEGTNWMAFGTLVGRWYSRFETQRAVNIYWAGIAVSSIVVPPLAVALAGAFSWRGPFVVLAAAGIILGIVFVLLVRDFPEQSPHVSAEEREFITANRLVRDQHTATSYRWTTVFTSVPGWWAALTSFATAYQTYMLLAWLPEFLVRDRHISYAHSGLLAALPFVAAATGGVSAAALSDWLHKRERVYMSRTLIPGLCAAIAGMCFIAIAFTPSTAGIIGLLMASTFCIAAANGVLAATSLDIFPYEPHMGTQFIVGFGSLAAIVAPLVTGLIVSTTQSFVSAFLVGGGTPLVFGLLCLAFLRVRPTPPDLWQAESQVPATTRTA